MVTIRLPSYRTNPIHSPSFLFDQPGFGFVISHSNKPRFTTRLHTKRIRFYPSGISSPRDTADSLVEWDQNEIAVVPDFHKRILFSDEAHFWLNGYVNKQNCRIWSEANPQVYVETPLHPEKLTVNGDRYRAMITNFFIPELNNHDVHELWFQRDGATCHTARATIDLLKDTFGDRLISRFGPVNWPPRSCAPLDYFLWGYVKSLVYADKPQTLDHLEDNIRPVIADMRPQMLEKVIENWTSRLAYIRASLGSPMPEIIFKMTATVGSDVVQSGCPIFDDFFQHLWPYIGNNTANVVFQMVERLWLIRIDQ
ncbi:transposase [Trichonephila clavipes]|nr:transposase [Trichonephila clavipes]